MRIKSYLRGLGVGIFIAAVLMGIAASRNKPQISDSEVKERAKSLGMVEESNTLSEALNAKKEDGSDIIDIEDVDVTKISKDSADDVVFSGNDDPERKTFKEIVGQSAEDLRTKPEEVKEKDNIKSNEEEATLNAELKKNDVSDKTEEVNDIAEEEIRDAKEINDTKEIKEVKAIEEAEEIEKTKKTEEIKEASKDVAKVNESEEVKEVNAVNDKKEENDAGKTEASKAVLEDYYTLEIASGISSYDVAKLLEKGGLVDSASKFDSYLCKNNYDNRINHGVFKIKNGSG